MRRSGRCPAVRPLPGREGGSRLRCRFPLPRGRNQEDSSGPAGRMPSPGSGRDERCRVMLRGRGICCAALVLVFFLTAASARAALEKDIPEGPVTIEADSLTYDRDEDTFSAAGKVLITFTGGFLKADAVTLYRSTNKALAEGNVYLRSDQDVLEGDRVDFDIAAKTGTVDNGKMFIARNHFYIKGEKIEKRGEADYRLENATVTTCDGEAPDWRLAGRELDLTVDGYGTLKDGRFLARDIPRPLRALSHLSRQDHAPIRPPLSAPFLLPRQERPGCGTALSSGPSRRAPTQPSPSAIWRNAASRRGWRSGTSRAPGSFGTFYGDYHQRPQACHGNRRKHQPRLAGGPESLVLLSQPRNDLRLRFFPPERHPPGVGPLVFPGL